MMTAKRKSQEADGGRESIPVPPRWYVTTIIAFNLVKLVLTFGGIALCIYLAVVYPLKIAGGTDTTIKLFYIATVDALIEGRLQVVIPFGLNILLASLWFRERRNRKPAIAREHRQVEQLENLIDPNRTSSGFKEDNP